MSDTKNSSALWGIVITTLGAIVVGVLNNYKTLFGTLEPQSLPRDTVIISRPQPTSEPAHPVSTHQKPTPSAVATGNLINSRATGQVVDENGQPVAGAKVRCTDCLSSEAVATTREDGTFTLPFQVERTHELQDIHLSVSGRKDTYSVRPGDPTGLIFRPN